MGWREIIQLIAAVGMFLSLIAVFLSTFATGTPFYSFRVYNLSWFVISACMAVFGLLNIPAGKLRNQQNLAFYILSALMIVATLYLVLEDNFGLAALFGGLALASLVAVKAGGFAWTVALLPALKAIPAAFSGYYLKKWLDERGKKKSTPETSLPPPTSTPPPADPTPVKSTRKRSIASAPKEVE